MFIKTVLEDVTHLVHQGVEYAVSDGLAFVPKSVRDELVGFKVWVDHFEPVSDEIKEKIIPADIRAKLAKEEAKAKKLAEAEAKAAADATVKALADAAEKAKEIAEEAKARAEEAVKAAEAAAQAATEAAQSTQNNGGASAK